MTNQQKTLLSIVLLAAVLGGGLYAYNRHEATEMGEVAENDTEVIDNSNMAPSPSVSTNTATNNAGNTTISPVPVASNTNTAAPGVATAKTGSATVNFKVPNNYKNDMTVNVSVTSGVITDVTYSEKATDQASQYWLENFNKSFDKSKIVGKKLSEVSLSKVGGASLTTKAFMNALNQAVTKTL